MFSHLSRVINGIVRDCTENDQPQIKAVLSCVEVKGERQEGVNDASAPLKNRTKELKNKLKNNVLYVCIQVCSLEVCGEMLGTELYLWEAPANDLYDFFQY